MNVLDAYIEELTRSKVSVSKIRNLISESPEYELEVPDFTEKAWEKLRSRGMLPVSRSSIPFSPRSEKGNNEPVPNITIKIPTGGGKTYVAVNAISRIMGSFVERNYGFVLWIVPNEAIYTQTLRRLKDRRDPYRQVLDRVAAGRVKIMEKDDPLDKRDIDKNLCIMILMLQSINRKNRSSLKVFNDRGDVYGFTPTGQANKHVELLRCISNLETYDQNGDAAPWKMIKDSLGNALRIIRPVVILDEGQKATTPLADDSIYGFNPVFVLELTATPKDISSSKGSLGRCANVLVDISGHELNEEGMIKMPLNVESLRGTDWKSTLDLSVAKLNQVESAAERYQADGGNYIRPIMLVQVERTGSEQRDGVHVHVMDVFERLQQLGYEEDQIAIKTSQVNNLSDIENRDLLSPRSRVRVIITRQALQEGWDCPFAYILCTLVASREKISLTQIVGRILRQPYAQKTGVPLLDQGYVVAHYTDTEDVVRSIRSGLERDGLSDLNLIISDSEDENNKRTKNISSRRSKFSSTEIFLPKVMWVNDNDIRELDYDTDILSSVNWNRYCPEEVARQIPYEIDDVFSREVQIDVGNESSEITTEYGKIISESLVFDPFYLTQSISDIVPNAFVARDIVQRFSGELDSIGIDEVKRGQIQRIILGSLRQSLLTSRTDLAEEVFRGYVESGKIQFRLRTDGRNWRMPFETPVGEGTDKMPLLNQSYGPLERSLFYPILKSDYNCEERNVAVHLDSTSTIQWWHRNVALGQYGLQGWKPGRIYPDFIFAAFGDSTSKRIVVLETKGDHFEGNPDTEYKKALMDVLTSCFNWEQTTQVGEMELVVDKDLTVQCHLVLMKDIDSSLPKLHHFK